MLSLVSSLFALLGFHREMHLEKNSHRCRGMSLSTGNTICSAILPLLVGMKLKSKEVSVSNIGKKTWNVRRASASSEKSKRRPSFHDNER